MNRKLQFFVTLFSLILVGVLLLGAASKTSSSPEDTYRHMGVFAEVLSKIKSDYVEEPEMKNVTLGALNGLLESLDPYASYLSPEQFKQFQKSQAEQKGWTGLVLAKRFGYVSIVSSVGGSPADKAGLTTGDMIETIQGVNTRDMPLAYAEMMLRGEPGTSVELGVLRFRNPEPTKISLVRSAIEWPAVSSKMLADGIGYIQVPTLEGNRLADVASAIRSLEGQGAKKLILDLRNSATGDPEQGLALANLFIDNGVMAYSVGQRSARQQYVADPAKSVTKLPLVVTTNRGTAGAAEIAAAALLEARRAEVVGERTYGDAAIRKSIVMDDGSAVILSVAKFYTSGEKAIQDTGVTPTVSVAGSEPADIVDDDDTTPAPPKPASGEDPILKKAIEISQKGLTDDERKAADSVRNTGKKQDEKADPTLGPLNIPKPE